MAMGEVLRDKERTARVWARRAAAALLSAALVVSFAPAPASAGALVAADVKAVAKSSGGWSNSYQQLSRFDGAYIELSRTASEGTWGDPRVPQRPHVKRSGAHGLRVSWEGVAGAKGYAVYRWVEKYEGKYEKGWPKKYRWRRGKWKRVKTLPAKSTSWRDKDVKVDKPYRYAVAACFGKGGKMVGRKSYWVEARAYSKGAKLVNPGKVHSGEGGYWVEPSRYGRKVGASGCRAEGQPSRTVYTDVSTGKPASHVAPNRTCEVRRIAPNGNLSAPVLESNTWVAHEPPGEFSAPSLRDRGLSSEIYDPELIEYLNAHADAIYSLTERIAKEVWLSDGAKGGWDAKRTANGSVSGMPSWMGGADRHDLAALFDDPLFDDGFYLESVEYDGRFTFRFYSEVVESVYPFEAGYRVFGPAPSSDEPNGKLANGWWLAYPKDYDIRF